MAKVKGSKISSKLAFVRDCYGEAVVASLIKSMTAADQEALRMVLGTSWYPLELYDRVLRAICKTVAGGDETIYEKIGHHSAEQVLNATYKIFRGKSPAELLKNMEPMHTMMNDPGKMEVHTEQEGLCRIKVFAPRATPTICKVARAFYHRAVELCGGEQVQVREPFCSGNGHRFCQFEISWQARAEAQESKAF